MFRQKLNSNMHLLDCVNFESNVNKKWGARLKLWTGTFFQDAFLH